MAGVFVVLSSFPDRKSAEDASKRLLNSRSAACVKLLQASSSYVWRGAVEKAEETLLVAKTSPEALQRALSILRDSHPYELPELLYFEAGSSEEYASWVEETTKL